MKTFLLIVVLAVAGCASFNNAMTPGVETLHDKFDDSIIVRQDPVSSSDELTGDWHTLGFEWNSKMPQLVFVTAGTNGGATIDGLAFKADGQTITAIDLASAYPEYENGWTTRRFSMALADFLTVSRARTVQMRLSSLNHYTVSTFGADHPNALVNAKFKPFTEQILHVSKTI